MSSESMTTKAKSPRVEEARPFEEDIKQRAKNVSIDEVEKKKVCPSCGSKMKKDKDKSEKKDKPKDEKAYIFTCENKKCGYSDDVPLV